VLPFSIDFRGFPANHRSGIWPNHNTSQLLSVLKLDLVDILVSRIFSECSIKQEMRGRGGDIEIERYYLDDAITRWDFT
jgi:hypothetical protein